LERSTTLHPCMPTQLWTVFRFSFGRGYPSLPGSAPPNSGWRQPASNGAREGPASPFRPGRSLPPKTQGLGAGGEGVCGSRAVSPTHPHTQPASNPAWLAGLGGASSLLSGRKPDSWKARVSQNDSGGLGGGFVSPLCPASLRPLALSGFIWCVLEQQLVSWPEAEPSLRGPSERPRPRHPAR